MCHEGVFHNLAFCSRMRQRLITVVILLEICLRPETYILRCDFSETSVLFKSEANKNRQMQIEPQKDHLEMEPFSIKYQYVCLAVFRVFFAMPFRGPHGAFRSKSLQNRAKWVSIRPPEIDTNTIRRLSIFDTSCNEFARL